MPGWEGKWAAAHAAASEAPALRVHVYPPRQISMFSSCNVSLTNEQRLVTGVKHNVDRLFALAVTSPDFVSVPAWQADILVIPGMCSQSFDGVCERSHEYNLQQLHEFLKSQPHFLRRGGATTSSCATTSMREGHRRARRPASPTARSLATLRGGGGWAAA